MKKVISAILIASCALMTGACGSSSKKQEVSESDYNQDIKKYVELRMEHAKAMKDGEYDKSVLIDEKVSELCDKYFDNGGTELEHKFIDEGEEAFQKEYEAVYGSIF